MITVRKLEGLQSLYALQAYHTLMLGLKMLPSYASFTYEEFYARLEAMSEVDQESLIREAALFVKLEPEEIEALISFCSDANGIPYRRENMGNLTPDKLHEIIVEVSLAISRIKIRLVSDAEKKN